MKLLMDLHQLEKSLSKEKPQTTEEVRRQELNITYDIQKLENLFSNIRCCLEGPLGSAFYETRKEFLILLCFYLWKKYMVNQMQQINYLLDQSIQ